jgi:hypothetical protein
MDKSGVMMVYMNVGRLDEFMEGNGIMMPSCGNHRIPFFATKLPEKYQS